MAAMEMKLISRSRAAGCWDGAIAMRSDLLDLCALLQMTAAHRQHIDRLIELEVGHVIEQHQ
jgi:hypothetical protein